MNVVEKENCLIVCSDSRSGELARILGERFQAYRRWKANTSWEYSKWNGAEWNSLKEEDLPQAFATLFFHTGQNDPEGIPDNRGFRREFAFSAGGVGRSPDDRRQAIPIQRRFPAGGCPVMTRHLAELVSLLNGDRDDLPAFCRHDESLPSLWSLVITSKAYAAAGIAYGALKMDHDLIKKMQWKAPEVQAIAHVRPGLADLWPCVQKAEWWQAHLGFLDEPKKIVNVEKYQEFLARLILDLELDVLARSEFGLESDADLAHQAVVNLVAFVKQHDVVNDVFALLESAKVDIGSVERAYTQVKDFLSSR